MKTAYRRAGVCSPACFEANTERMLMNQQFLPICRADMLARGWQDVDLWW